MKNPTATARALHARVERRLVARSRRRQLARELASYMSAADRSELDSILGRHSAEEIREIEQILSMQAVRGRGAHPLVDPRMPLRGGRSVRQSRKRRLR